MYLRRIVCDQLLDWKNDTSHSTLEVSGTRQIGEAYIISKFADENFRHKIYINLFEQSGQQSMGCYKQATSWTPGTRRPEHPPHDAFRLFNIEFTGSDDTVIIIDEIQESAEIYSRIREFTRQFKPRFIITGGYLGKIYKSDFRCSSGDITAISIYTLSFEEFLLAYDSALCEQYQNLSLDTPNSGNIYTLLRRAYDIYCQVGGYPRVVETYLETRSFKKAQDVLIKIIDTFISGSIRCFTDILDTGVFIQIFLSICRILNRKSQGLKKDSISEKLQKLVTRDYLSNISKAVCSRVISWLYFSSIIGLCTKIMEMDVLDFKLTSHCYFMDLDLANYHLTLTGIDATALSGTLNENFVYINLKKCQDFPTEIAFETPTFATYRSGEIDFVAQTLKSHVRYLIEVKAGKDTATTSFKALKRGKTDYLLHLKGDTKGEIDEKVHTPPIYLLERSSFQ